MLSQKESCYMYFVYVVVKCPSTEVLTDVFINYDFGLP